MTEQEAVALIPTDETAKAAESHTAAIKITSPGTKRKAVKTIAKVSPRTDEEKRLARNAALREWRRKNADHMKAYMSEWRAKRKGEQPVAEPGLAQAAQTVKPATASGRMPSKAAKKKTISKKPKKGGRR